jgi:hypothetical protein
MFGREFMIKINNRTLKETPDIKSHSWGIGHWMVWLSEGFVSIASGI